MRGYAVNFLKRLWKRLMRDDSFGVDPLAPIYPAVTPDPDSAKALELAWQRRRKELADWQPSDGWIADRTAGKLL